jgi:hypothetical protein
MAPGSSRIALLSVLLLGLPGCWTGHLIESGRVRESVLTYRGAALDGELLRLDYTVERIDARHDRKGPEERSALVALADLDAKPEHAVDAFPLRRIPPDERSDGEIPLIVVEAGSQATLASARSPDLGSPIVEVDSTDGRHEGFRLCSEEGAPCPAHFHSGALTEHTLSWWVYPLAPFAVGVDLALLPLQALTLPPLLLLSD